MASERKVGGIEDVPNAANDLDIQVLARWAVDQYNKRENAVLQYVKVLKAKQQIVAGIMYYIALEATSDSGHGTYEAKIWGKGWENFIRLEEFKHLIG